jgi:hypothetical protein
MYKIAKEKFGFQLTFEERVSLDEMKQWKEESKKALVGARGSFGVLIDMRTLRPGGIQAEAQAVLVEGQGLYKKAGMERSCVILQSALIAMQFQRLAKESGIYAFERYIYASTHPDWRTKAIAWLENKIDPDL